MTAPRAREQSDPPSPSDRRPPRRGGGSSPSPYAYASAAGRAAGPARPRLAPRGLLRSARALAAAALLALSGALALPATAQADVLVSNIGTSSDAASSPIGLNWDHAQGFVTGANSSGYTLTSIEVKLSLQAGATSGTTPSATLHKTDAANASVATLTGPSTTTGGNVTFNAPANTTLDANSTYFILLQGGSLVNVERTDSDSEDTGGLSDWTVLDAGHYRNATSTFAFLNVPEAKQIRVNGSAAGGTPSNNAPVFSPTSTTRTVEENSAAGTNVGAVIPEATDADSGDTLTYSMEGTDATSFAFDASTRQITTITGVTYNFEATKNSYSVTVKASDGTASATIAVTIDVTDVREKSAKPDKPTLAAVTGSSTTLTATWTKPDLDGGPDISQYFVQRREGDERYLDQRVPGLGAHHDDHRADGGHLLPGAGAGE